MKNIILENDEATSKLGELISKQISKIDQSSIEIHLEGDLGAGKTFLTRSIISRKQLKRVELSLSFKDKLKLECDRKRKENCNHR